MSGSSDFTQTPNLLLYKPVYNADVEQWGNHLNANADVLDATVAGLLPSTGPGNILPAIDGIASAGVSLAYSRADHVHPADSSYNALAFGVICDGVTDQGAALNAALSAIPAGASLYLPGSVYTSQTITVTNGRRLITDTQNRVRVDANTIVDSVQIIGANALSPVVLVQQNLCQLVNIAITRNGTPPAGSVGLSVVVGNQVLLRSVDAYNHDVGIQIGAAGAANGSTTTVLEFCTIWNCLTDYVYLINSPECTFIQTRFGCNGANDPPSLVSCVHIDGDNNTTAGPATANTLSFIRCQFNPSNAARQYVVRWTNYASPDGVINFADCYMSSATVADFFIDPGCQVVRRLIIHNCFLDAGLSGATLISDTGHRLTSLSLNNCILAANLSLSGISNVVINGNTFNGTATLALDTMGTGACVGNCVNTLRLTGAFTGAFQVANNAVSTFSNTATGPIAVVQLLNGLTMPAGTNLSGAWSGGTTTIATVSSGSGVLHMAGGAASVNLDANTIISSGNATIGTDTYGGTVYLALDTAVGQERGLRFLTAGALRWKWRASIAPEGGGNAGSNLALDAYADNGTTLLSSPISVTRSTGLVSLPNGLTAGAGAANISSGTGAATGTQPAGSLWLRTDGATGTRLYVSAGGGTWNAVAGV